MITIELDPSTILITAAFSIVSTICSSIVTWYFSKRHYTRESATVTENDIVLLREGNEFKLGALVIVGG